MAEMTEKQWLSGVQSSIIKELTTHKAALPAGFNQERFALNTVTVISEMLKDKKKKTELCKLTFESMAVCLCKAAYLGLDYFNGECYAIPYGGELNFQTDYKGEIKMCKRFSRNPIKDIFAKVVRQDDFFTETVPGMLVQWHYATPFGVQFNQFQAFKYCEEQLPAGTYNVIIGDTWGNNCVKGKTYQFTLTKPVPAKGQLAGLYRAPDVSPSEWKVYSFESNTATDPIETVAMVEGTGGTALGTLSFKPTSPLNGLQSTAYGYNRWAQSAMRQWLNSEEANGKWWTPQHNFDRTPDQLKEKHGFLTGFDEEFTKRLKATKVSTWKNTLTDNGDTDGIEVTYDKVFLPSLEAMSINPQKAGEDDVWEYWKRASGMAEKMQQYKTYPQIRTFAIENHTSPVPSRPALSAFSCVPPCPAPLASPCGVPSTKSKNL